MRATIAIGAAALMLTACGGGNESPDATDNGLTTQPAAEAPVMLPPENPGDMNSEISNTSLNAAFGSTELENVSEANKDDGQ
jgi:ABC-type glycerol-3-phosphate transport system substrate-binding protein